MSSSSKTYNRDVEFQTDAVAMQPDSLATRIRDENYRYQGTGGTSAGNHRSGFIPAFRDKLAGRVYLSCFANGELAPIHILDGLPKHLCKQGKHTGGPSASEGTVTSGFIRNGRFYTRTEAANWIEQHTIH